MSSWKSSKEGDLPPSTLHLAKEGNFAGNISATLFGPATFKL